MPGGNFRIFLATQPIDFRKGMDGLAAHIANSFDRDPFDGAIYVFRSRRADRLKLIYWDGTGLVLILKRIAASFAQWQAAGHLGDMLSAMRKSFADARR
ncbi:IS66 family insertion sequence element accessory protein TnpB [Rhodobacter sp. CZR27]|uniref:IS66 family insertion sequence element accessory protein TnpB n=1 Tax=Rhodobacter sp. CZR27 TaxID=2033869 RepID=UPI001E4C6BD5|nr:IS66 family insertion sequence element accessory protein TnpB [Rhodobacter sp. CZR27]